MTIRVYGKTGCGLCKSAKTKVEVLLNRWGVAGDVEVAFLDMEADEHAAAESDFFDVFEVPSVLVMKDQWDVLGRWDGQAPPSDELQGLVCPADDRPSAAA